MPLRQSLRPLLGRAWMILLGASAGLATSPPPSWMHRAWTQRNDAPRFVQSLAQDSEGFLWLGSYEGLFRFDGDRFEPIAPAAGHPQQARAVSALAAGPDGRVWIGYARSGGVSLYYKGRITDTGLRLTSGEVTRMVAGKNGDLWIGLGDAPHAIYHYAKGQWQAMPHAVLDTLEGEPALLSSSGSLWFSTWSGPLLYQQRGAFLPVPAPIGMRGGGALVETGGASGKPQLWALDSRGLQQVPPYDRMQRPDIVPPPRRGLVLPKADFFRAVVDPSDQIWASTFRSGILHIDPQTRKLALFGEKQGLSSDRASPILADRQGNIWVGTERGLDRFTPSPLAEVPEIAQGMRAGYLAAASKGIVYLAGERTIWRVLPRARPQVLMQSKAWIYNLCADQDGTVWAAQKDRLAGVAGAAMGRSIRLPAVELEQQSCALASDGTIWLATSSHGLFHYTAGQWSRLALPAAWGDASAIAIDRQDRLYAILGRSHILRHDHGRNTLWTREKTGLDRPSSITIRDRDVLVGGLNGLVRLGDKGIHRLDSADHPWLYDMRAVVDLPGGWTWLLGYKGLMRVGSAALEQAFATPDHPLAHTLFDDDDRRIALPQRHAAVQAVSDGAGRGFVLTRSGVLEVTGWQAPQPPPFKLFVRQLMADGRDQPLSALPDLPHGTAAITITYGALDLTTSGQRRFRIRLLGQSAQWNDNGALRQITYANLAPGAYRFEVQSNDALGQWQQAGAAQDFVIEPAFWQTWWFRGSVLLALGLLLWSLYRWRMGVAVEKVRAATEAQLSERERIARELHDTLLQGVQGMMLRFQAVAERPNTGEQTRDALEEVLERGDDVLAQARDRVHILRLASGNVDLLAALRLGLEEHGAPPVSFAAIGRIRPVCAPIAEEIVCLAAEAVSNARQHAQASQIALVVNHGWRMLKVSIADNGIGIGPLPHKEGHFGLQGMEERARQIGGRLKVTGRKGQGTEVVLTLPNRLAYSGAA